MPPQPPNLPSLTVLAEEPSLKPFAYKLPMDQQQATLASIALPVFYPGLLVFVGAAGFIGMQFGRGAPGEQQSTTPAESVCCSRREGGSPQPPELEAGGSATCAVERASAAADERSATS